MRREGKSYSVRDSHGDEHYRIDRSAAGHWLWCDKYGNTGGDSIDLVREIEPGTGFAEAVYRLSGAPSVRLDARSSRPAPVRAPLQVPEQAAQDMRRGRAYLQSRGISPETIEQAEKAGMLRYARGGVLFVGRDGSGTVQSATRRATDPADAVQKRDLRGSDKSYPPILPGDPAKVWIVEGGADALALHDIARRSGKQPPTVIVSGGAQVRSFLERAEVQAALRRADRVTVAGENEKTDEAQARADAGHQRQAGRVAEITGREVRRWTPAAAQGKDLADVNLQQQIEAEAENQVENRSMEYGR